MEQQQPRSGTTSAAGAQIKHTRGPWFIWNNAIHAGTPEKKTKTVLLGAVPRICEIDFDDVDVPRRAAKANARLIAAAPELLAALQDLVSGVEYLFGDRAGEVLAKPRAVIAKATGSAQ